MITLQIKELLLQRGIKPSTYALSKLGIGYNTA